MPTFDQYLNGVGTTNQAANLAPVPLYQYLTNPNYANPLYSPLIQQGVNAGNLFATGGQQQPTRQLPAYMNLANIFSQINAIPPAQRESKEDVPYDLLGMAGMPDSIAARLLATAAYARNESKAKPGWRPTTFQESGLENLFQQWIRNNDLNPAGSKEYFPGYDMRGWFQAMMANDPGATLKAGLRNNVAVPLFPNNFSTPYDLNFNPSSNYWDRTK